MKREIQPQSSRWHPQIKQQTNKDEQYVLNKIKNTLCDFEGRKSSYNQVHKNKQTDKQTNKNECVVNK